MSDNIKSQFTYAIYQEDMDLNEMLKRIDEYYIMGKLTQEERNALYQEAREQAVLHLPDTLDIFSKIAELNIRVNTLEAAVAALQAEDDDGDDNQQLPDEYVDGHWYTNGDRVLFEGKVYVCVNVPEGNFCVWSPAVYPAYWQLE